MNHKEDIRQIDFDKVKEIGNANYMDDGIAFHTDFRELPFEDGSNIRLNMLAIIACNQGMLQIDINATTYTLHPNEVLTCRPNDVISNCMLSPKFQGAVFCLSHRGIVEQYSITDLWEKAFIVAKNPIIRISQESQTQFDLYGEALIAKLKMKGVPYYRESILSITKACLYELLANVDDSGTPTYGSNLITQKEVQFKRFIDLIAGTTIKPRNVSWYANQLCITPKYLSTVCKQISGKTALHWINEYVLMDIRYWLKNSEKTIKEIVDLLKFPNISFFGKYCRTHFGMSPTEYRKQLREQPNGGQETPHA